MRNAQCFVLFFVSGTGGGSEGCCCSGLKKKQSTYLHTECLSFIERRENKREQYRNYLAHVEKKCINTRTLFLSAINTN